jgi:hypothetical protein
MSFFFTLILAFISLSSAQAQKNKKKFGQKISIKMSFSGDLAEAYQFDGNLGDRLKGETENQNSLCKNTTTFRSALYRNQKSIEVWIQLLCTIQGQKSEYNPHRFFIDPLKPDQTVTLPAQSEKLKKISIHITDLEVKANKSK